jgi:hypothetical protein
MDPTLHLDLFSVYLSHFLYENQFGIAKELDLSLVMLEAMIEQ